MMAEKRLPNDLTKILLISHNVQQVEVPVLLPSPKGLAG